MFTMTIYPNLRNILVKSLLVFCILIPFGNTTTRNKDSLVVDADPNIQQRISILVGKAGEDLVPDLEDLPSDNDNSNNEPESKNTNYEGCQTGRCCFQYTWQGYIEPNDIPAPENTTCEYLKKQNKDTSFACFDPIIYTTSSEESKATDDAGNPPDIAILTELSQAENWNVYCPLTKDKSCMTLRFYSRGGKKSVANETRFCGSVTESNSGKRITSGCFTENVEGFVKEVCVCSDSSLCNSAPNFTISPSSILLFLIFFTYTTFYQSY